MISEMLGVTEKAVLEIASFEVKQGKENDAQKVTAGTGAEGLGDFDQGVVDEALNSAGVDKSAIGLGEGEGFKEYGKVKRYRYNVMFNPEEIRVSGYGGEEVPTQEYAAKPNGKPPEPPKPDEGKGGHHGHRHHPLPTSRMATPQTRMDFNVKLVLDKSDPIHAFYGDKFTLSQTNMVRDAAKIYKSASNAMSGKDDSGDYSVQADVEAISAAVRDKKKRLCRFVWGDMVYEGMLNTVSADYVMFNMDGTPCRAYLTIGMVLYDRFDLAASQSLWVKKYNESFSSAKANQEYAKAITVHEGES